MKIKRRGTDPAREQSVTTLKQWKKKSSTMYVHTFSGRKLVNFYHPIVHEVSEFFQKIERKQKQGLEVVLAFQESLKGGKHAIH